MNTNITTIQSAHPSISLRRFCEETGLCYQYVLKASKRPIAGQAYDPESFNVDAVNAIIARKGVDLDSIDWDEVEASLKTSTPVNKPDDFKVGTRFTLREPKVREITPVYTVVYITATHVVFLPDEDSQPRVMNWDTFTHQSPRIQHTDDGTDEE